MIFGHKRFMLSTGRVVYANRDIVGLDTVTLEVFQGYDGDIPVWPDEWSDQEGWTPDERRELAEYMIERWTAFRDATEPIEKRR